MNISFNCSHGNQDEAVLLGEEDGPKAEHQLLLHTELDLLWFLSLWRCPQDLTGYILVFHLCRLAEVRGGRGKVWLQQAGDNFSIPLAPGTARPPCAKFWGSTICRVTGTGWSGLKEQKSPSRSNSRVDTI